MLCQICQKIFRNSYPSKRTEHHCTVDELQQAALEACYICRVLWYGVSALPPDDPKANSDTVKAQGATNTKPVSKYDIRRKADQGKETLELSFIVDKHGVGSGGRAFTFCLQATSDAHGLAVEGTYDISDWTSSMTCARNWLSQCLESHNKCQASQSTEHTQFSPTRLLEIGQPDSEKVRLRLFPNQGGTSIQYATLSHCWGSSNVLRLTSTSFQRLERGIEISELAQTFQDAILTARSLGIWLLWIDSLCIFQDSHKDWEHEAALMSHVYRNAILNIAASVAADSNAGCFPKKVRSSAEPCIVQTAWTDSYNDTYHLYHDDFWDHTLKNMPLTKRAWVVQELLLAPRVLHLNGKQLFWECYNLSACETYPGGTPPTSRLRWISGDTKWQAFNTSGTRLAAVNDMQHAKTALSKLWVKIVEMYTKCDLTYTTDKLVALSGVAKLMEQALDDEYCAGLWKSRLVTELFWIGPSNKQALNLRPSPYCAPSWSWACLDGRISAGRPYEGGSYKTLKPLIDVHDCDIEITTSDRTGAVIGGSLQISGWIAFIQLHPDPESRWRIFFDGKWWKYGRDLYINLDCIVPFFQIHCLPLFIDTHQLPTFHLACLLLSPTGNLKGQFQRIGVLIASSGALGMKDWTGFRDVANEAWIQYETSCGNKKYTISII
ncbi:heterokaryon incompatibility protein-domain-containing protein [Dendryphion nanum]|uniref:Heterokaryon incompatibility protein-domain-containing protein n=1 Tax=Dendryphion nanum TaxID=256645 RepID=A0A9P9DIC0_9PLEO|nr:heterokaryon incompatibility protein-domain-containing protein [Dendryphion nanum]